MQVTPCISSLILTPTFCLSRKRPAGSLPPSSARGAWQLIPHLPCNQPFVLISLHVVFMPYLQVALQRLMAQAYHSVAAMYEDRHFLWGLAGHEQLLQRSVPARRAKVHLCHASPGPCHNILSGLSSCSASL